jgi:hypothetical protein
VGAVPGVPETRKPNVVAAPAPSEPLYATLRAVTADPLLVTVAFHDELIVCPPVNVQPAVQPEIAAEPATTLTSAWKPPPHEDATR